LGKLASERGGDDDHRSLTGIDDQLKECSGLLAGEGKLRSGSVQVPISSFPRESHAKRPSRVPSYRSHRLATRAAVLGANDGIVSTANLVLGVAAAGATHSAVMTAGVAGLVAGVMSMAAGEYVSVRSQSDSETAALTLERAELEADDSGERRELTAIYVGRGVDPVLAKRLPSN
jgi:hypothetical protein